MSQIGPSMPAHLAKRKRTPDEDGDDDTARRVRHASPASFGPTMPPTDPTPRSHGPSLPPGFAAKNEDEITLDDDESDADAIGPALPAAAKPARPSQGPTMGPAMPPPDMDGLGEEDEDEDEGKQGDKGDHQKHSTGDHSDAESDDSDYGPALPKAGDQARASALDDNGLEEEPAAFDPSAAVPSLRDDWMLAPPTDNSIAALAADPTKIRSRKFATGRAAAAGQARAGSGGAAGSAIGSLWTETLEQKQKRLADTVLGRAADPRQGGGTESQGPSTSAALAAANAARNAQIKAYTEATRGKSLYEQHQSSLKGDGSTRDMKDQSGRVERHEKRDREDREERRHRDQDHDRHDRKDRGRRRHRHRDDERDCHKDGDSHKDRGDRDDRDGKEKTERQSGRDERSGRDDRDRRHRRDREDRDRHRDREDRHNRHSHRRHGRHDRDSKTSSTSKKAEEKDDPSARAFDREKDMNIGAQFNNKQRRELVTRANDFGGRFSKGNFL